MPSRRRMHRKRSTKRSTRRKSRSNAFADMVENGVGVGI